jgi:hypothetical protein
MQRRLSPQPLRPQRADILLIRDARGAVTNYAHDKPMTPNIPAATIRDVLTGLRSPDADDREAQLHAVYLLAAWNQLDPNAVRPLLTLESAPDVGPSERTYLQSLRDFVDNS